MWSWLPLLINEVFGVPRHSKLVMIAVRLLVILAVTLSVNASAENFRIGDHAYLCLQRTLHPNWPEFFALKVEVIGLSNKRFKVRVLEDYPMPGRTNPEETQVKGDVLKVAAASLYRFEQAGVSPGERFEGKPVCRNLMK